MLIYSELRYRLVGTFFYFIFFFSQFVMVRWCHFCYIFMFVFSHSFSKSWRVFRLDAFKHFYVVCHLKPGFMRIVWSKAFNLNFDMEKVCFDFPFFFYSLAIQFHLIFFLLTTIEKFRFSYNCSMSSWHIIFGLC